MRRPNGDQPPDVAAIDRAELIRRRPAEVIAADDPAQAVGDQRDLRRPAPGDAVRAELIHAAREPILVTQPDPGQARRDRTQVAAVVVGAILRNTVAEQPHQIRVQAAVLQQILPEAAVGPVARIAVEAVDE